MNEVFIILLAMAVLFSPLILSIVAIVRANAARRELNSLRNQLARLSGQANKSEPKVSPVPTPLVVAAPSPASATAPPPAHLPAPAPIRPPKAPAAIEPKEEKPMLAEVAFGGRLASFAGIALLLIGVAFLIGYAIKHAWLGPEARIVLGLLCGAALVVLGHVAEVRGGGRLSLLARVLTGGGAAIFYFCVFAAYGIYHLIGTSVAAAGLIACAAAALGLAMAYRSQAVALIGVLGAFLMPPLIGRDDPNLLFLLSYIAVINMPVIALGIYRSWQALYNFAFGFSLLYLFGQVADAGPGNGFVILAFAGVYFLQFAALGLFKLRAERQQMTRTGDILRLILNSLALLGALYAILERMNLQAWTGAALVAGAVVHLGLVRLGWRWFPSFTNDLLALLVGALTLVSLALPVQLDGVWVSAGWSIEGALLCWLALRARIGLLQVAAFLLGMIGLFKSLVFDLQFYAEPPTLFLNARFLSGLASAALLGLQGHLHARHAGNANLPDSDLWRILPALATLAVPLVFSVDLFWTLGDDHMWAWLGSGLALMVVATVSTWTLRTVNPMGLVVKMLLVLSLIDMGVNALIWWELAGDARLFFNAPFAVMILMVATALAVWPSVVRSFRTHGPATGKNGFAMNLQVGALFSGVLLVTTELYRITSHWDQVLVTIWWASCAIAMVISGLKLRKRPMRYAGLGLFAVMTVKVLLIDLAALSGLERIAAFMGAGILLLIVSFVYQRAAAGLVEQENAP